MPEKTVRRATYRYRFRGAVLRTPGIWLCLVYSVAAIVFSLHVPGHKSALEQQVELLDRLFPALDSRLAESRTYLSAFPSHNYPRSLESSIVSIRNIIYRSGREYRSLRRSLPLVSWYFDTEPWQRAGLSIAILSLVPYMYLRKRFVEFDLYEWKIVLYHRVYLRRTIGEITFRELSSIELLRRKGRGCELSLCFRKNGVKQQYICNTLNRQQFFRASAILNQAGILRPKPN